MTFQITISIGKISHFPHFPSFPLFPFNYLPILSLAYYYYIIVITGQLQFVNNNVKSAPVSILLYSKSK